MYNPNHKPVSVVYAGQIERGSLVSGYKWRNGYTILFDDNSIEYPWLTWHEARSRAKELGIKMPKNSSDVPKWVKN